MENDNFKTNIKGEVIIFSISEYIELLNIGLKRSKAKIIGEVGKVDFATSGHVYFSLRDEKDKSKIECIIWKSNYGLYGVDLKEGVKIIATGCPNIYAPSGKLSFIADAIELSGEGALKKEYERLKKQLAAEGLFAEERKRPLPFYPQKIGLITSKKGAVLGDFLSNIGKFGFKIKMIDSRVEGQEAVPDLLSAIKTFRKEDIDLLAIIRGGGSMESLMPFNNELLVREVANFPNPVIVAIGHDKDEPLIDFVADVSVSTPSIVAITISQSWNDLALFLEKQERDIFSRYQEIFDNFGIMERKIMVSFESFKNALLNTKNSLKDYLDSSLAGFKSLLSVIDQKLAEAGKAVFLNNPERQLKLGYSIARCGGKIVRSVKSVKLGDDLDIRVVDGNIVSEIKDIK